MFFVLTYGLWIVYACNTLVFLPARRAHKKEPRSAARFLLVNHPPWRRSWVSLSLNQTAVEEYLIICKIG